MNLTLSRKHLLLCAALPKTALAANHGITKTGDPIVIPADFADDDTLTIDGAELVQGDWDTLKAMLKSYHLVLNHASFTSNTGLRRRSRLLPDELKCPSCGISKGRLHSTLRVSA